MNCAGLRTLGINRCHHVTELGDTGVCCHGDAGAGLRGKEKT